MKDACKFPRKYRKYRIFHTTSGMRNAIYIPGLRGLIVLYIFVKECIKVGFPPSLTLMAIFFANVSLKYGYICIILDFFPRSTKKEYLFFKYR